MNKGYIIGGVALLAVLILGMVFPRGTSVVERVVERVTELGAAAGPEHTEHQYFKAGHTDVGVFRLATTASAYTLKDSDIRDVSVIHLLPETGTGEKSPALTLTLPATSTWASLPANGVQSWVIDNTFTAAGTTTTITAGAGVDIDGLGANDDVINGGVSGILSCWRYLASDLKNFDVRCLVREHVDAG
jgi:hypothetical protein